MLIETQISTGEKDGIVLTSFERVYCLLNRRRVLTKIRLKMGYMMTKMASLAGESISSIISDPSDCTSILSL